MAQLGCQYTLRKDHKEYNDEYSGPHVRPVCKAVVGYNCRLSHMMNVILAEVWKSRENSAICMSTEDMIAEMDRVSQDQENDSLVIGSTDVVAFFFSFFFFSTNIFIKIVLSVYIFIRLHKLLTLLLLTLLTLLTILISPTNLHYLQYLRHY